MIKILPLHDKKELDRLNDINKTNACLAYCMYDKDEMQAYLLYNIENNNGIVEAINSCDIDITDGLIRATASSLLDLQIDKLIFSSTIDMQNIYKLELVLNGEYEIKSIKNLLYNCKNCQKHK